MKRTTRSPSGASVRVRPTLGAQDLLTRRGAAAASRSRVHDPSPIRVLVVDDERLGRERLAGLLAREPEVRLLGQCSNGADALRTISEAAPEDRPELVLLDVQMPDLDGIEVAEALLAMAPEIEPPEILFVTAYDAFMARAFELHAVGFLRKPFTDERFADALAHARKHITEHRLARRVAEQDGARGDRVPWDATLGQLQDLVTLIREERPRHRIAIRDPQSGALTLIDARRVAWVEAHRAGQVLLHGRDATRTWDTGIEAAEQQLAPLGFVRVGRNHLIHPDHIVEAKPLQKGQYMLTMQGQGDLKLDTGRAYAATMARILDGVPGAR